jgi:hypothetical protein
MKTIYFAAASLDGASSQTKTTRSNGFLITDPPMLVLLIDFLKL